MYHVRLSSLCVISASALATLLSFSAPARAQKLTTLWAKQLLEEMVVKKDTTKACASFENVQNELKVTAREGRFYLFEHEGGSSSPFQVTIETNDGQAYTGQLPCIFFLPLESEPIKHLKLNSETPPLIVYNFQDSNRAPGLQYASIPQVPGPPFLIIAKYVGLVCCKTVEPPSDTRAVPIGLDKPRIRCWPIKRKATYITTFFGVMAGGSIAWYALEFDNAQDHFKDYETATSTEEALSRRIQTEKARSRCKIARNVTIGSGIIFAALLYRDLRRKEPPKTSSLQDTFLYDTSKPRLGFNLDAEPDLHALSIGVQVSF